jgi:predicted adenylyl cyclase CyaB
VEIELRFELTAEEFRGYQQEWDWSPETRVRDLTLGPSGAASMQIDGWVVRVRQQGAQARLEYKAPRDAAWSAWLEYSTEVGDFRETVRILSATGLQAGLVLDRTRRTAQDGPVMLALDDVRGLGHFIEIAAESDAPDDPVARAAIATTQARLGLTGRPAARPYGELLLRRLQEPDFQTAHSELLAALIA